MATGKVIDVEIVELRLTKTEADTLSDILERIGGSATSSRRKLADAIAKALSSVGKFGTDGVDISTTAHSIYFTERV